jgi:ACS family hexuronate transporter-like MFS transporter
MGVCACLMPLGTLAALVPGPLLMIALVGVAAGAHQGWSANLFTTTSDIFPKQAVASVTGIGGAFGGLGGVIFASLMPGYVVSHFGYTPVFLCMGVLHLIAFFVVHKLLGRMKPVQIEVA